MSEKGPILLLSKAPEDPEQKKEWAYHWMRVQLAFYVDDGAKCFYCGKLYTSVDDMIQRNPKRGWGDELWIDTDCWKAYEASRK